MEHWGGSDLSPLQWAGSLTLIDTFNWTAGLTVDWCVVCREGVREGLCKMNCVLTLTLALTGAGVKISRPSTEQQQTVQSSAMCLPRMTG